jgi:hypothetical protein
MKTITPGASASITCLAAHRLARMRAELMANLLSLPKDQQDDFRERLHIRAEECRSEQAKEVAHD